mgnify:CR=1 FL=1
MALSQIDTLDPDERKEKVEARKKACGREPLLLSGVRHEGLNDALRQLAAVIDQSRAVEAGTAEDE